MIAENQKLVRVRRDEPERTCIVCPIGCRLHIEVKDDGELQVTGNRCKRGEAYAREEYEDPRRILTATCAIIGGSLLRVPVRSTEGVPVDRLSAFLNEVYQLRVEAPVESGQTIAENVAETGVDLVATATIERRETNG
jgi:CxxC motif-containing protein